MAWNMGEMGMLGTEPWHGYEVSMTHTFRGNARSGKRNKIRRASLNGSPLFVTILRYERVCHCFQEGGGGGWKSAISRRFRGNRESRSASSTVHALSQINSIQIVTRKFFSSPLFTSELPLCCKELSGTKMCCEMRALSCG